MKAYWHFVYYFLFISVLVGCAKDEQELENPVLAEVGESKITASQLVEFESRLPKELKTKKAGLDGYRDYLQTVIDKEIFLQEALKRGLDKTPEVAQTLRKEKEDRVLRLLFKREFVDKVQVAEEEIRQRYEAMEKEREVELRLIIVESETDAQEILHSIEHGGDFAELAMSHSLHKSTAPMGGALEGYFTAKRIPIYLRKYISALKAGQYSAPIRLPSGEYGIYQVTDEREVSYSTVHATLSSQLNEEKTAVLVDAYLDNLRNRIKLEKKAEGLRELQDWVKAGRREDFTDAERAVSLYEFDGGSITVGDFWNYAADVSMGFSGDIDEAVQWFADDVLLSRALFLKAAREESLDSDPEIAQWEGRRRDALLLLALRQTAVKDQVVVEPEAVRKFYDDRPEMFTAPEEVAIREIMVKTREEASALKEQIEAGADMGTLADQHTLRALGKGAGGEFHIHPFEQAFYKELIDATRSAEIGVLNGPLAVTAQAVQVADPQAVHSGGEYYSIFKVVESNFGSSPDPFEKVAKRAHALLKRAEESRIAGQFLMDLRQNYGGQVVINDDNLKTLISQ